MHYRKFAKNMVTVSLLMVGQTLTQKETEAIQLGYNSANRRQLMNDI